MLVQILQILCLVLGLVVTVAYAFQAVYLFVPLLFGGTKLPEAQKRRRYAILVAARNESAVLGHLLDSLNAQKYPRELFQVYVVADNCTDHTADIAEAHGAAVYRRFNQEQIGKGYALNYLLDQIRAEEGGWSRYDGFLIFDADNIVDANYLEEINKVADAGYSAFCGYRNTKNFSDNWISAGHSIWYLHDCVHLCQSRMRLGVSCAVTGTGFGFTRELLERLDGWQFHTLTEDIEFSVWCITHGVKIGYAHDAIIYDEQPNKMRVSWRQRTRWSQGDIQVSFRCLKYFPQGFRQGGKLAWSTLEALTHTLWGYCTAGICVVLNGVTAFLTGGWTALAVMAGLSVLGALASMFLMGALVIITEWKRIRATAGKKLLYMFTFPFYFITSIPNAMLCIFQKFEWVPVEHRVAVSAESMQEK